MIIFKPIYYLLLCAFYFYANCQDDLPPYEPDVPIIYYDNRMTPILLENNSSKYEIMIGNFSVN